MSSVIKLSLLKFSYMLGGTGEYTGTYFLKKTHTGRFLAAPCAGRGRGVWGGWGGVQRRPFCGGTRGRGRGRDSRVLILILQPVTCLKQVRIPFLSFQSPRRRHSVRRRQATPGHSNSITC